METPLPPLAPTRRRFLQRPHPKHPNSVKNSYILVLGTPNSGKSTTINTLFNHREIATISPAEGTNTLQEFSTNFRTQRNLKIIDTPGLGSPHNTVWDTKVLATIKKYLDTDLELRQCIPNVVLIITRFDDPNLTNPSGPFVKSLMAINLLNSRLFDKFSCNVIILLTHFTQGHETYKANPRFRQDEVMDLIKNYTEFPQMPYIIFGDNSFKEEPVKHAIFGVGYKLENEVYPINILNLIIKISAGSTKGAFGPEFFGNVFQNRESIFLWKSCNLGLVSSDRKRFRRAFYALKEVYKVSEDEVIPQEMKRF